MNHATPNTARCPRQTSDLYPEIGIELLHVDQRGRTDWNAWRPAPDQAPRSWSEQADELLREAGYDRVGEWDTTHPLYAEVAVDAQA